MRSLSSQPTFKKHALACPLATDAIARLSLRAAGSTHGPPQERRPEYSGAGARHSGRSRAPDAGRKVRRPGDGPAWCVAARWRRGGRSCGGRRPGWRFLCRFLGSLLCRCAKGREAAAPLRGVCWVGVNFGCFQPAARFVGAAANLGIALLWCFVAVVVDQCDDSDDSSRHPFCADRYHTVSYVVVLACRVRAACQQCTVGRCNARGWSLGVVVICVLCRRCLLTGSTRSLKKYAPVLQGLLRHPVTTTNTL